MTGPANRAARLDDPVNVLELCTPIEDCSLVQFGPIDEGIVVDLRAKGFDQALVRSASSEREWGLVTAAHLEQLKLDGLELREDDEHIRYRESYLEVEVQEAVDLLELLDLMRHERAVLVAEYYVDADGYSERVHGLLTISDLNRHGMRAVLFSLFALVEAGLASLLSTEFPDPWGWIRILPEDDQARILGYWEVGRRRGVDIGPTAATTLAQLLRVFEKKTLFSHLDISREEFGQLRSGVPEWRNRVMHPVRPLVLEHADVEKLYTVVSHLRTLRQRLHGMGHVVA
jgi:hypothetical protein